VISGTPTAGSATTTYTINATNGAWTSSATVTFPTAAGDGAYATAWSGHKFVSVNATTAGVASIPQTGTASAPARTTPAAVEGPLIRYDTSEAEITRLYRAYSACLKKQGIPLKGGKGLSQDPETLARYKRELTACAGKRPEDVPHREERKDPGAFQDHLRQQVKCMKAKGLDVVLIPPNGWGVSDEAAERGYEPDFRVVNKCQLEAFGG
jgi:hypothetical protein